MTKKTAIIIGGGLGGLFTAAILTRNGIATTVLEKCAVAGGGLQTFKRYGYPFDAGMHIIGGLDNGGNVHRICHYLGIADKLKTVHEDIIDTIHYMADGITLTIPRGRKPFQECLVKLFPDSATEVDNYFDAIYDMAADVDLFNLRESADYIKAYPPRFFTPASSLINEHITNPVLRNIMAFVSPMYGGSANETPAYIHAIISVLYIEHQGKFYGGARQLTDALVDVIIQGGGRVFTGDAVSQINVSDGRVSSVVTSLGATYTGDYYVSAIHPQKLLPLMPQNSFKRAYTNRIMGLPNSYSAFQAFFVMKHGTFPYRPGANFMIERHSDTWHIADYDNTWPKGLMYITPAGVEDTVVVNAVMPFSAVEQWQDSTVGKRPGDYYLWKEQCLNAIVERMSHLYPGFADNIEHAETSSPLTIRDFYDVPQGTLYGFARTSQDIMSFQMTPVTRIPNLFLTGQCINLHGLCGVPLTAVSTAEAILGRNSVVRQINDLYNNQ